MLHVNKIKNNYYKQGFLINLAGNSFFKIKNHASNISLSTENMQNSGLFFNQIQGMENKYEGKVK